MNAVEHENGEAPSGAQAEYFRRLASGRFDLQRCEACSKHVFFPREICPHCGEDALVWYAASGDGVVYSWTTVRRKPEAGGDYNVSLIDLSDGVRLMSRVVGVLPDQVSIGMAVKAEVQELDGSPAVVFVRAAQ